MSNSPTISIILGYRNRDRERVQRCLESLADQTIKDFEVLFVDFGSDLTTSSEIKELVDQYPFTRYFYSDTRGQPWNRAKALNIGIRRALGRYIFVNDIDMILAPDGLEILQKHASLETVLQFRPILLPQNFGDWKNVFKYQGQFPLNSENGLGVFQLAAAHFQTLHGFDEFYRYYGVEDRDLRQRLDRLGVRIQWLNEIAPMFHQWHPAGNYLIPGFMPDQVWMRMNVYYHKKQGVVERNAGQPWGQIVSTEDRAVFAYINPQQNRLLESEKLHHFFENPLSTQAVATMIGYFFELPSGHAIAVHHSDTHYSMPLVDRLVVLANILLKRRRSKASLGYNVNLAYEAIHYLIEQIPEQVADYYLDANGVSIVVKL